MEFFHLKAKRLQIDRSIVSLWLCIVLIPLNLYGDFITKKTGINSFLVNATTTIILFILIISFNKRLVISKLIVCFLIVNVLISVIHIIIFRNIAGEIKHILFIIVFMFATMISDMYTYSLFKKVILALTVVMSIDAIIQSHVVAQLGYRMFNVRNYTMLDKMFYTELFSIAVIILFNRMMEECKKRRKLELILWMVVLIWVLFGLFEAKIGLLSIAFAIVAECIFVKKEYRKYVIRIMFLLLIALGVYFLFFMKEVPDYIIALKSFFEYNYNSVNRVYFDTYFTRFEILSIVFIIFLQHPFIGIGYGNYYSYVSARGFQNYSKGIEDIESAFFALLAEGGTIYFLIMLILFFVVFNRIIKNKSLKPDVIGIYICMLVLILGNDFMNLFYWVWLGIIWRVSRINEGVA